MSREVESRSRSMYGWGADGWKRYERWLHRRAVHVPTTRVAGGLGGLAGAVHGESLAELDEGPWPAEDR